jgi:integrase
VLTPRTLSEAVQAFLLSRQVGGFTSRTVHLYREVLGPFQKAMGADQSDCDPLAVQKYLTALRSRVNGTTTHLHFSKLRAFFGWCIEAGLLREHPLRGLTMKAPKTLPRVPEDETIRKLLLACPETYEGRRNRALIALLADSGLRISEALRLRIEDVNFAGRTVSVRAGKGQKDGVGFFGAGGRAAPSSVAHKAPGCPRGRLPVHRPAGPQPDAKPRTAHFAPALYPGGPCPKNRSSRTPALRGDVHSPADRGLGASPPSAASREPRNGSSLRAPHEARREREVQESEPARQPAGREVN